ncbi:MAG: hypothetical protein ACO3LE_10090 [Bdellovibrionota bacterium]
MKKFKSIGVLSLLVFNLTACGDGILTGVDPAKIDGDMTAAGISFQLASGSLSQSVFRAATANSFAAISGVEITEARANIEEIRLELPEGMSCADVEAELSDGLLCEEEVEIEDGQSEIEAEIHVPGPFVVNLLTGESTPSLASIQIPSGMYREIEIKFDEAQLEDGLLDGADALIGNTIYIEGSYQKEDSSTQEFIIALGFSEDWEMSSAQELTVLEGATNQLSIEFNQASWFNDLPLDTCLAEGDLSLVDGVLVIDESTDGSGACADVEDIVKDNFENSGSFDDDDDDDDDNDDDDDDDDDGDDD